MSARKLTLDDIAEPRAYEREREDFRRRIIELKKLRRVSVGPIITLMFENRDTIRFQIQEMARAENIITDEGIQHELETYNPLIADPGELSATLFIELTSREELKEWLPKLVGIERAVELRLGEAGDEVVPSVPEEHHEAQLTREGVTPSVHYVRFELTPHQVRRFAGEPVILAVNHPAYQHGAGLADETKESLLAELRPE